RSSEPLQSVRLVTRPRLTAMAGAERFCSRWTCLTQGETSLRHVGWWRPDCVAGHVGLELRNVDANYPLERSHRFAGIQPNSGLGDYSRLSCDGGRRSSGLSARISAGCLRWLEFAEI